MHMLVGEIGLLEKVRHVVELALEVDLLNGELSPCQYDGCLAAERTELLTVVRFREETFQKSIPTSKSKLTPLPSR